MSKTVSILGCGWLGLPLARSLGQLKYTVKGSTTSPEKLSILENYGIIPYLLNADPQLSGSKIKEFFMADVLVLTIPFRRNLADPGFYKEQIKAVAAECEFSSIDFVIFSSSTSVYPDKNRTVKEDKKIFPDDDRARVLLEIEDSLLHSKRFDATIIRFAGLYGYDRQPGRFLENKESLKGGNKPVNLIHRDDCVEILTQIITQDIRAEVFNAVSDFHPTRQDLYAHKAMKLGKKPPEFIDETGSGGKIVSNRKLKERLNYRFKYPDPLKE